VSYTDRIADLIGDRLDSAIRIGNLQDSSLIARRIAPVRAALVASPGYLARQGRPETPDDLSRHECLIYTGQTSPIWQFGSGKRLVSVRPSGRLRSDSSEALLQWAVAGLGIAHLPSFLVADEIETGLLAPLLQAYQAPEFGIFVVRPPGIHVPGKVRILIDALVERFGGEPDWDRCLMRSREMKSPPHQTDA
jgi:DNA-binding transcriptional LysR family regulator